MICQPLILSNLLKSLPKNLRELAFDITKQRTEIRNHINHPDKDVQTVRLKYQLDPAEFTSYDIAQDSTTLILSSQDFLSIVELSEVSGDELKITFTKNGRPLIASFEMDASVKVQMVMSTMREETLKTMRKPPGATTYKALMGSYIESRRSAGKDDLVEQIVNITESMLSPQVGSFESNSRKKMNAPSDSNQNKRRSVELANPMPEDNLNVSQPKRRKSHELSQRENQEVSQILADLVDVDDDDTDGNAFENPPGNTSKLNLFDGLADKNIRVRLPNSQISTEGIIHDSHKSVRLDISKVNFNIQSDDTDSIFESNQENLQMKYCPANGNVSANNKRESLDQKARKRSKYYEKLLFNPVQPYVGNKLADMSDNED